MPARVMTDASSDTSASLRRLTGAAEIRIPTRTFDPHSQEPQSDGLPQLDAIALRIGDPAEATDTVHVLLFFSHVRSFGAQLGEHRIQVADPEVEHGLLGAGPEVVGLGLECRKHRRPGSLRPKAAAVFDDSISCRLVCVIRPTRLSRI